MVDTAGGRPALVAGRGALLLVPEIALTPQVAGQFHHRFGDKVAILRKAFDDAMADPLLLADAEKMKKDLEEAGAKVALK